MLIWRVMACSVVAVGLSARAVVAGPDWIEHGNAGSVLATAQQTIGIGQLETITGSLDFGIGGIGDVEDMFLIQVVDPANFSMTIASADFDAQLFVFNVTMPFEAFGLLANQGTMDSNVPFVGPFSNDGSGAQLTQPGVYAIAISAMGRVPVSHTGEIFFFENPYEISGPDGPGGTNPHIDWAGEFKAFGSYTIELEGVWFYDVPAPGGLLVLAMAAMVAPRRRR